MSMTPEEFRRYGRQVVDWIADYWDRVESMPVRSQAVAGQVRGQLPAEPPSTGEPFEALLADMDRVILPGVTHWQHPRFFAYFPSNTSGPAVLGDLLAAGLGLQGMLWETSPACTELEQHVLDWLADLLDLPPRFRSDGPGGGVILDTASTALLVALVAALHRASEGRVRAEGTEQGRYAVYASTEAHSSIDKALAISGLGERALRRVDVDPGTLTLDVAHLRRLIEADHAAGVTPVMVVATIGTTSTTAIDPVAEIGELCAQYGLWLHVDAAYAGVAAVCPELRWINDGVEHADSYVTNPHKWLLTNHGCDALWVADRAPLIGALSVLPEYLRTTASESGQVVDYRDWQISLGRPFRALKLWSVIRCHGADGLRAHIRRHVELAAAFAGWVRDDERFEIVAGHPLSLVCFRRHLPNRSPQEQDEANLKLLNRLNDGGRVYLTRTKVAGRVTLRLAVGGTLTRSGHVEEAWRHIQETVGASG